MKTKTDSSVVRISRALDERLGLLAARTGRRKSFYASKAISDYLEDNEDYLLAVSAYEESRGKRRHSLDEVAKRLGLERGIHAPGGKRAKQAGPGRSAARS
jgi:RHH-type rel operon transcriptional repressor/antitoxin RelB